MRGGDFGGDGGGETGSLSTVSREDNMVMSSEDSSSPDHEAGLELGLGLSLCGVGIKDQKQQQLAVKGYYARILTAKDLPSVVSASSSSSTSSSTLSRANTGTAGTKRSADCVTAPNGSASIQVVGWPPIRAYRMNSMVNQAKSATTEEFNSMIDKNEDENAVVENTNDGSTVNNVNAKARTSLFVKVNMDGIPIGRKVDLNAHGCYEALAQTLEDMFLSGTTVTAVRSTIPEHNVKIKAIRRPKLLDGSFEFVLTYEDKDGDWMLVGDVPWRMFLNSVKRLKIMRTSEATGLAPSSQQRNMRQRNKP